MLESGLRTSLALLGAAQELGMFQQRFRDVFPAISETRAGPHGVSRGAQPLEQDDLPTQRLHIDVLNEESLAEEGAEEAGKKAGKAPRWIGAYDVRTHWCCASSLNSTAWF